MCRFFKEFADHETESTPEFRHPYLKGHYELDAINLLDEVAKYGDLYSSVSAPSMRNDEKFTSDNKKARDELKATILEDEAV